jgi:hypothetical protein
MARRPPACIVFAPKGDGAMIASFTPRPGLSRLALFGLVALGGVWINASTAEAAHEIAQRALNEPAPVINDLPKIQALKRLFPERYQVDPARVTASGHASGCLMCRES